jgi:hypothetical protein
MAVVAVGVAVVVVVGSLKVSENAPVVNGRQLARTGTLLAGLLLVAAGLWLR